jgi:hypothetical protein
MLFPAAPVVLWGSYKQMRSKREPDKGKTLGVCNLYIPERHAL